MKIVRFPDDPPVFHERPPIAALGNFDGVHRGHQRILERVLQQARQRVTSSCVVTFDPHPPRVVRPDKAPALLMTLDQRLEALEQLGVDCVAIVRFSRELATWEPEMFVEQVLVKWLRVGEVWVGENFLFGRERSGNFSLLRLLGQQAGFTVEKVEPVRYREFVVSSTRVRRLLAEGRVDEAASLLGHGFFIDGQVVEGDQRGRTIGFPTANIRTANELLPAHGVYASVLRVNGALLQSVTNVGVRPTIGQQVAPSVETHVLDGSPDLYGARVRLFFTERVRDEQRFDGLDALKAQIAADCEAARRLFDRLSL